MPISPLGSRFGGIYTAPSTLDPIQNQPISGLKDDTDNLSQSVLDAINKGFQDFMNNADFYNDAKKYNADMQELELKHEKELMQFQYDLNKKLRSSQMQDSIEDLRKAGINPAVYFSYGGTGNQSMGVSSGSMSGAHISNPNADTISSLVNSYASVLMSIASNKNADSAILRSIIGAVGSIFSLGGHFSSSQNISDITRYNG